MITYILFLLGFSFLFLGGKYLVTGAVSFAKEMNISPLIIGVVLVGFGTSLPELFACITAILNGSPDIAVGNIVGSNIANILLVLSTGAIICKMPIDKKEFKREGAILVLSSILLTIFCFIGVINLYAGILFDGLLLTYVFYSYKTGGVDVDEEDVLSSKNIFFSLGVVIISIAAVAFGADLLIDSSIKIARMLGVSEALIGLSAVAIGTSLPELATIISASMKKHTSLALGNIIGSNIFNTLGILGTTAIVKDINISSNILKFDIWAMNLAVFLMIILSIKGWCLTRNKGIFLLSLYILYIVIIVLRG